MAEFEPECEVATFPHFGDDLSLKIWWWHQKCPHNFHCCCKISKSFSTFFLDRFRSIKTLFSEVIRAV